MNPLLRRRLEMAIRVRDLLRAHNTDGVGEGLGLGRLEQLIERAQVLAARQRAEFRLARGGSQEAFVMTVRAMLEKAIAQQEQLVKQGMPASLLDDLTAALGEFEKTLDASRAERREHVKVIDDLIAVGEQIDEQIHVLDGLVRFRYRDDADLMTAWALIVQHPREPSEVRQVEFV
ncbi:MAG TPA: hypothetical protein VKD28_06820 [Gemmatimonadales bacterium]|nr:hypothetical protein [Gemmatimonadales bacterium]